MLLDAVVGHYTTALWRSGDPEAVCSFLKIPPGLAERCLIGISDRTLGNTLPERPTSAGRRLRDRLTAFGILRASGHEAFRGCVVVPVRDEHRIVALFAKRLDRTKPRFFASGLPGGVFLPGAGSVPEVPSRSLLLVASIEEALVVAAAGFAVAAPGRPAGFSDEDLHRLSGNHEELVVLGRQHPALARRLAGLDGAPFIAGEDVAVLPALSTTTSAREAVVALLAQRRSLKASEPSAVQAPAATATAPTPTAPTTTPAHVERSADSDEIFLHAGDRSWRVRGASSRSNGDGELLKVALSVTDAPTGRFHLDTVDLYSARQRSAFVSAAAAELHQEREGLVAELGEVIAATERHRDANQQKTPEAPPMTAAERDEALVMLCSPGLLSDRDVRPRPARDRRRGDEPRPLLPRHDLAALRAALRRRRPVVVGRREVDPHRGRLLPRAGGGPRRALGDHRPGALLPRPGGPLEKGAGGRRGTRGLPCRLRLEAPRLRRPPRDRLDREGPALRPAPDHELRDLGPGGTFDDDDGDRDRPGAREPPRRPRRRRGPRPDTGHPVRPAPGGEPRGTGRAIGPPRRFSGATRTPSGSSDRCRS